MFSWVGACVFPKVVEVGSSIKTASLASILRACHQALCGLSRQEAPRTDPRRSGLTPDTLVSEEMPGAKPDLTTSLPWLNPLRTLRRLLSRL
jgi:hypothetical protein